MEKWLMKIRNFMMNRYGIDKLGIFLFVLYLLINGISSMFRARLVRPVAFGIALLILAFAVYRVFSKDIFKRQQENVRFENILISLHMNGLPLRIRQSFKRLSLRFRYFKTHRFRTCPHCGEYLRLTKKRGKRNITCPKCGERFSKYILF